MTTATATATVMDHLILVSCDGELIEVSTIDHARDLAFSMAEETGKDASVFWNGVLWETYEG